MLSSHKYLNIQCGGVAGLGFAARQHFMSIGNWKHAPNLDAAAWACAEIWPRIRQTLAAAPAPAAPLSDSRQEDCRAAAGGDLAASSSGTASAGDAAASGSRGARASLPDVDSNRMGAASGARSCEAAGAPGPGVGGEAGGGGAALAGHGGAAHAEAPPELHLYGAYESHAARALHAPERGVFVKGHAPTLEARRPTRLLLADVEHSVQLR